MPTTVSGLDVLVALILGICVYRGWRNGLLKSIFSLVSVFLALALANTLSGAVSAALRQTQLFDWLQTGIANALGIGELISAGVEGVIAQADTIAGLPLPQGILSLLHANNNPEMHSLLGITHIEDYITGFVAMMILNIASAVLVFLIVLAALRAISRSLRLFNHIPIIGSINRMAGAAVGAAVATLAIWLIFAVISFLEAAPHLSVEHTIIAKFFYENNLVLDFLTDILEPSV